MRKGSLGGARSACGEGSAPESTGGVQSPGLGKETWICGWETTHRPHFYRGMYKKQHKTLSN